MNIVNTKVYDRTDYSEMKIQKIDKYDDKLTIINIPLSPMLTQQLVICELKTIKLYFIKVINEIL